MAGANRRDERRPSASHSKSQVAAKMGCVDPTELDIHILPPTDEQRLAEVIELADANKRWLGFMSRGAFEEEAQRLRILVAVSDRKLAGYALFGLPDQRVRLAHLCVSEAARGKHVALRLVDALSRLYADRLGISLRCRRDYPAHDMWPKLGFSAVGNRPGRSAAGHELTSWWRDHGHPTLFKDLVPHDRMIVALDTNVFRDIHESNRSRSHEAKGLTADWLESELELAVTATLTSELNNITDPDTRRIMLGHLIGYQVLQSSTDEVSALQLALLRNVNEDELSRDVSLRQDVRLLAEAAAGGASVFVTRDTHAADVLATAVKGAADIEVLTPTELLVSLDETRDAANYSPRALFETGFSLAEVTSGNERALAAFINHAAGETRSAFLGVVRDLALEVGRTTSRQVLTGPEGRLRAAMFTRRQQEVLEVPLLRVAGRVLSPTITTQMIHLLRVAARKLGHRIVRVTDDYISRELRLALLEQGFTQTLDKNLETLVVDGVLRWQDAARLIPSEPPPIPIERLTAGMAAALERRYWPLKISDAPMPCFMVPITPGPADLLFGKNPSLFHRDARLGLSRRHVYYRSPPPSRLRGPARLAWYESGPRGRGVIATSTLERVVLDSPQTLYARFQKLGVWPLDLIAAAAHGGVAAAMVFRDTELFTKPVALSRLRTIAPDKRLEPLMTARSITPEHFFTLYAEGRPE